MRAEYTEDGKTSIETATFTATCTAPPSIIQPGELVTLQLALELSNNTDEHFQMREYADVRRDIPDVGLGGAYVGYERFRATVEGEPDSCEVWAIGDWGNGPVRRASAELCNEFATSKSDDRRSIYFSGCGAQTVWTYEWVDSSTPIVENTDEEWEDYYDPVTEQHINTDASDTPGTQSNTIDSNVVEKHDPTEGGLYIAIAAGTVVIGGVTYAVYKRKRNPEAQEKMRKTSPRPPTA